MSDPLITGYSANRLHPDADNPREVAFAAAWREINVAPGSTPVIYHLLPNPHDAVSQRVASTIVQWLGSNVGMGFLDRVVQSSPEVRDFLLHSCRSAEALARIEAAKPFSLDEALAGEVRNGPSTTEFNWHSPEAVQAPPDEVWELTTDGVLPVVYADALPNRR